MPKMQFYCIGVTSISALQTKMLSMYNSLAVQLVYDAWHADMNWVLGKVRRTPGFAAPARQIPLGH